MTDKAEEIKRERAQRKRAKLPEIRDRRRFKVTPVPTGEVRVTAPLSAERTLFPNQVAIWDAGLGENVLKDGRLNSKIGGDVLVGRLRGARVFTLSLEERRSCPRECQLWRTCYGNSMQYARRWLPGPELEARLEHEVRDLCKEHEKVLIRLHVLGDFYSDAYIGLWSRMMRRHRNLHVFGFTAHPAGSPMGDDIAQMRKSYPGRWSVRHSGFTGKWGTFTIDFPTERPRLGDALVCPEQRAAMGGKADGTHCGSCAACWATDAPIVFIEH